ncbi:hypothetical protein C0J52_01235 [Blattella germanica]|nr:hypothetical protein C0J52_01235 [Blattella germanica]
MDIDLFNSQLRITLRLLAPGSLGKIYKKEHGKIPGKNEVNQIDHILVSKRWATDIENVQQESTEDIETNWLNIKNAVIETADDVLGQTEKQRNEDWFDDECHKAVELKKLARLKYLQRNTRATEEEYNYKINHINTEELRQTMAIMDHCFKERGLKINVEKTKYMLVTKKENNTNSIKINDYTFDQVQEFTYLGSKLNSENNVGREIKQRITNENRTYYMYSKLMKSKMLNRELKLKMYKTLIRPVVVYEC